MKYLQRNEKLCFNINLNIVIKISTNLIEKFKKQKMIFETKILPDKNEFFKVSINDKK